LPLAAVRSVFTPKPLVAVLLLQPGSHAEG
jgi:hypothetical protein